jgi:spermidine/putrescine transport system permease protein
VSSSAAGLATAAVSAVADAPPARRRTPKGTIALWIVTALGILYLLVPLLTIVVFTFNEPVGRFNTTWNAFTWDNWLHPFKEEAFTDALIESVRVALIACTIATALGTLVALALTRYRMQGGVAIGVLLILPITTPEIVMGASLFTLFLNQGASRGFWTIVIAHTAFCLSFVAMTMKARIRGIDWTLEDAAMDLGSPPLRTFFRITLPLIVPGIIAAFMLSIALSIDDYIITSFVAGDVRTFPRQVFDASRVTIPPQAHVLATMIMIVALVIIVGGTIVGNRRAARQG